MKHSFRIAGWVLCILSVLGSTAGAAPVSSDPDFSSFCSSHRDYLPPADIAPTSEDHERFPDAKSCPYVGYTYLIGEDADDLVDARRCWLATDSEPLGLGFLFANGWGGVKPDYDASLHFLCRVDLSENHLAIAELRGLMTYVDQEMRSADKPAPLSFCDHATSGFGSQQCQQVESLDQEAVLSKRYAAIQQSLKPTAHKALDDLQKAADAFADADADWRWHASRGGTLYVALVMGGVTKGKTRFIDLLEQLTSKRAPATTLQAARAIDKQLNIAYQAVLTEEKDCPACLAGTPEEWLELTRAAERAWLAYRRAWVAFYTLRWKGVASPATLRTECEVLLSEDRIRALRHKDGDGDDL